VEKNNNGIKSLSPLPTHIPSTDLSSSVMESMSGSMPTGSPITMSIATMTFRLLQFRKIQSGSRVQSSTKSFQIALLGQARSISSLSGHTHVIGMSYPEAEASTQGKNFMVVI
jgi:hypothetical protein